MARNHQLETARQATPSPRVPGACLSRAELAEAVNAWLHERVGTTGAMDANYIAKLERGAVRLPGRDYRAAFRAVLSATEDAEIGFVRQSRSHGPLMEAGPAELDPVGVMNADDQARLAHVAAFPRRVDASALHALAETLAAVRRLEDETSAADVLPSVLAQQQLADRLSANAPERLRAHAVGLFSEIEQYLGWLDIPGQHWAASQRHLDRAIVLAMQADDPQRLATGLSFSAYKAMLVGDITAAASLSDIAGREGRIDPGLRAYMTVQRAEVAAFQPDADRAVQLLTEADSQIERIPDAEELPDSSYWYIPSVLTGHKGFVLHALGDNEGARHAAAESLAAMPGNWRGSEWAAQHRALAQA